MACSVAHTAVSVATGGACSTSGCIAMADGMHDTCFTLHGRLKGLSSPLTVGCHVLDKLATSTLCYHCVIALYHAVPTTKALEQPTTHSLVTLPKPPPQCHDPLYERPMCDAYTGCRASRLKGLSSPSLWDVTFWTSLQHHTLCYHCVAASPHAAFTTKALEHTPTRLSI